MSRFGYEISVYKTGWYSEQQPSHTSLERFHQWMPFFFLMVILAENSVSSIASFVQKCSHTQVSRFSDYNCTKYRQCHNAFRQRCVAAASAPFLWRSLALAAMTKRQVCERAPSKTPLRSPHWLIFGGPRGVASPGRRFGLLGETSFLDSLWNEQNSKNTVFSFIALRPNIQDCMNMVINQNYPYYIWHCYKHTKWK